MHEMIEGAGAGCGGFLPLTSPAQPLGAPLPQYTTLRIAMFTHYVTSQISWKILTPRLCRLLEECLVPMNGKCLCPYAHYPGRVDSGYQPSASSIVLRLIVP